MPGAVSRVALIVICSVLLASVVALTLRAIDARRAPPITIVDMAAERPVIVMVDGAVASPGVQTLPAGARLNDAVAGAGGFTSTAETNELNLARLLVDGERVTVGQVRPAAVDSPSGPATAAAVAPGGTGVSMTGSGPIVTPTQATTAAATTGSSAGTLIDINTASSSELESLPGIGPVLAERIIAYREDNGPFLSVDELEAVDGISTATVAELRPLVNAGASAP